MANELRWHPQKALAVIAAGVPKGLTAAALVLEGAAKSSLTSQGLVDTGNLRGSVTYRLTDGSGSSPQAPATEPISTPGSEDTARVGTAVEYGTYHEYGTCKMIARPWLRPSVDSNAGKMREAFAFQIRKALS